MEPVSWIRTGVDAVSDLLTRFAASDGLAAIGPEAIGPALAVEALKASFILTLAVVATLLLTRGSAAARHRVWSLAVVAVLALPLASMALPKIPLAVLPSVATQGAFANVDVPLPPLAPLPPVAPVAPLPATEPTPAVAPVPPAPVRGFVPAPATEPAPDIAPTPQAEPPEPNGASVPQASAGPGQETLPGVTAVPGLATVPRLATDLPGTTAIAGTRAGESLRARVASWAAAPSGLGLGLIVLLTVWVVGAAYGLLRILAGVLHLRRIRSSTTEVMSGPVHDRVVAMAARMGLRRSPVLLSGDDRVVPMTWGAIEPVLLLPVDADQWPLERLDAVLAHELGHILRRDYPLQMVADAVRALYWFNPLAWWAADRMRVEREHACDDLVVHLGGEPLRYAQDLLDLARAFRPARPVAALCFARRGGLRDRLVALMDVRRNRQPLTRTTALLMGLATAFCVLPVAAVSAVPASLTDAPDWNRAVDPGAEPIEPSGPDFSVDPRPEASRVASTAAMGDGSDADGFGLSAIRTTMEEMLSGLDLVEVAPPLVLCGADDGKALRRHTQRNDERLLLRVEYDACDAEVELRGNIDFTEDFTGIQRLDRNASMSVEVRRPGERFEMEVEAGSGGTPEYRWRVNGDDRPYDAEAQAWFRDALVDVFRLTGYKAEERADWIYGQGGASAVLQEVQEIEADYGQSLYLAALLDREDLTEAEVRAAFRMASREIESDHSLSEVLQQAAGHARFDDALMGELITATATIESDHNQAQVLSIALRRDDLSAAQQEALLEATASGIESDHQVAEILTDLAQRYTLTPTLRDPYLRAAETIESDHNRTQVYSALLRQDGLTQRELAAVLQAASTIESDHNLAELLIEATAHDLGDAELRAAFIDATRSIESDHNRTQALQAALNLPGLQDDQRAEILASARHVESDHNLAELLEQIAGSGDLGADGRQAYLESARSIESDHSLSNVLLAFNRQDLSEREVADLLDVALLIDSDHNLEDLLEHVAEQHNVRSGPAASAFERAIETLDSDRRRESLRQRLGRVN